MSNKNKKPFFIPSLGVLLENRLGVIINKNAKMPERDHLRINRKKSDMASESEKN